MKKIAISSAVALAIFGCTKNTDSSVKDVSSKTQTINASEITIEEIPQLCYFDDVKNDSVYLKISDNLGTITGKLIYKNAQKDSSSGDVMGFMSGDTLKLDYMFSAEGTTSTREIWFLKKNDKLMEGIGEQDAEGRYLSAKQVLFEGGHTMQPADCEKLTKNFK